MMGAGLRGNMPVKPFTAPNIRAGPTRQDAPLFERLKSNVCWFEWKRHDDLTPSRSSPLRWHHSQPLQGQVAVDTRRSLSRGELNIE